MSQPNPKIYLLPNLMTAGNLFCGFAAVLCIYDGAQEANFSVAAIKFHDAIWFILAACIFDLLDGRLARLGGHDSPFGREFDSLADIVSFGMAPALLVYQIVLGEFQNLGWMIAFVYLACGTLRLARFNCVAANGEPAGADKNFTGFPITAAAGVIASITLFLLWLDEGQRTIGEVEICAPAFDAFPVVHDVQQVSLSELQSDQLAHDANDSALPVPHRAHRRDREVLSMDGGDYFPHLPALRISAAVPFSETATRDRGRDRRRTSRRDGRRSA